MKRLLLPLAVLAIAGSLLGSAPRAYACSCVVSSPQQSAGNADVIVIGTVIKLTNTTEQFPPVEDKTDGVMLDTDGVVLVERYLKGNGPAQIEVDDPPSGGACGFLDEGSIGKRHLLFLEGETSPFRTHLCSGSISFNEPYYNEQEQEYVEEFLRDVQGITGPGTLPDTGSAPFERSGGSGTPWLAIGGAIVSGAAALAASAWLLRRVSRG